MTLALFADDDQVVCEDAFSFLDKLPSESVDLIITDPPYESLEQHRSKGTTTRLTNDWFPVIRNREFYLLFELLHIVAKPNAHMYIICDDQTSDYAIKAAKNEGWAYWKRIVWDKMQMGMGYHYRNRHEFILFFEKGHRRLNNLGVESILPVKSIRRPKGDPARYPTEKPVALIDILINNSSKPGDLVLDPFCGSGSTLVSAKQLGRRYWGCDLTERAVKHSQERLAQF
ncbi:site-specific DNA-methyltransferase [Candidatus Fermentibacteria bacterium]|nr:MAG: site-specific DNA-methyltransferase [Candidatus Fermentibacteria bacterium]